MSAYVVAALMVEDRLCQCPYCQRRPVVCAFEPEPGRYQGDKAVSRGFGTGEPADTVEDNIRKLEVAGYQRMQDRQSQANVGARSNRRGGLMSLIHGFGDSDPDDLDDSARVIRWSMTFAVIVLLLAVLVS